MTGLRAVLSPACLLGGSRAPLRGGRHGSRRGVLLRHARVLQPGDPSGPAPGARAVVATSRRARKVLDVGCGVGRWSRLLAARGAQVTGIDLSPTMIARSPAVAPAQDGVADRCRFLVQDLAQLDAGEKFDLLLGVTVLQHILDPEALRAAVQRMADHLAPGGRMVLLEAAPAQHAPSIATPRVSARASAACICDCSRSAACECARSRASIRRLSRPGCCRICRACRAPLRDRERSRWPQRFPCPSMCVRPLAAKRSWHAVFVLEHAPGVNMRS